MRISMSFRSKIFFVILVGTLVALSLPLFYTRVVLQEDLVAEAMIYAKRELYLVARLLNASPHTVQREEYLHKIGNEDADFLLLNTQGKVLATSHVGDNAAVLYDFYARRPEVLLAIKEGEGIARRYNAARQSNMIHAAIKLDNGNILRLSIPFSGLEARMESQIKTFSMVIVLAAALSFILAFMLSGFLKNDLAQMMRVVQAISLGKYQRRLRHIPGKEFVPLADAVNRMAAHIEEDIRTAADQKEQLQSILDTMTEGVLVLGQRGGIRSYNKALVTMFPAVLQGDGVQVVEVVPIPALQEAVEDLLHIPSDASLKKRSKGPLQWELALGRTFAVHMVRAGTDMPNLGAVVVFHDITSLVHLERVRRDFIANVSHEIRTPLTAIQGYAETLAGLDDFPKDCQRFVEIIRKKGVYLSTMVEELLVLARLESTELSLPKDAVRPLECAQSAFLLCRQQLDMRAIQVRIDIGDELVLMAHKQYVTQVFRNLLENAGRYAPEGGQVRIIAQSCSSEKNMVRFAICDNGPGIPTADHDRIFERFYRVEKHRSHASTGLGLAICKHTVERLGGRIWVESPTKEYATVFFFTLPITLGDELCQNSTN